MFRVARILGLLLAMAAITVTITALALDRWALVIIAQVGNTLLGFKFNQKKLKLKIIILLN